MFLHSFKYSFKTILRDKVQMFWSFIFVLLLGTLFRSTFGNAYEKSELIYDIEVIAYIDDGFVKQIMGDVIENITVDEAGEKKLLNITYADTMEEAKELFDKSGVGLLYCEGRELKLLVKENGLQESIISNVVSQYHQYVTVIMSVADAPAEMQATVMMELTKEASENVEKTLTDANMDVFNQYFFNLLTMGCLMAATAGVTFTIKNQANLSDLGARKSLGGSGNLARTFGGLTAIWLVLSVVTVLAYGYLVLIGVNLGNKIPAIILTIFVILNI